MMQWYSYSLPSLLMQTFWMDKHSMDPHSMDPYWWDTCWRYVLVGYVLVGYVCDSCWCTTLEWIRIAWIRIGGIRVVERIRIGGIRIGGIRMGGIRLEWICVYMCDVLDMCGICVVIGGIRITKPADANLFKTIRLTTFWMDTHCMDTYWWDTYGWDTFGMDMCGICVMCWICVGYVWCEIRQQSSEEPCDETSFGKKIKLWKVPRSLFFSIQDLRLRERIFSYFTMQETSTKSWSQLQLPPKTLERGLHMLGDCWAKSQVLNLLAR